MDIGTAAFVIGLVSGCITLVWAGAISWRWSRDKLRQRRWRKSDMAGADEVTTTDTAQVLEQLERDYGVDPKPRAQIGSSTRSMTTEDGRTSSDLRFASGLPKSGVAFRAGMHVSAQ